MDTLSFLILLADHQWNWTWVLFAILMFILGLTNSSELRYEDTFESLLLRWHSEVVWATRPHWFISVNVNVSCPHWHWHLRSPFTSLCVCGLAENNTYLFICIEVTSDHKWYIQMCRETRFKAGVNGHLHPWVTLGLISSSRKAQICTSAFQLYQGLNSQSIEMTSMMWSIDRFNLSYSFLASMHCRSILKCSFHQHVSVGIAKLNNILIFTSKCEVASLCFVVNKECRVWKSAAQKCEWRLEKANHHGRSVSLPPCFDLHWLPSHSCLPQLSTGVSSRSENNAPWELPKHTGASVKGWPLGFLHWWPSPAMFVFTCLLPL